MGIVNVTDDSFSDGGRFREPARAIEHGLQLRADGADLVDVGGESTRPGAQPVPADEELRRVIPVIEALAREGVVVSVDTLKPEVMRAAVAAGCAVVNDVNAFRAPGAIEAVARADVGLVPMHMQGTPQTMQIEPRYQDVVKEVGKFFADRLRCLKSCGVSAEQVVLDVGIGFGKTLEHNLQLLAGLRGFTKFERPLLLGVSRKSFIGKLLDAEVAERLPASLACTVLAVEAGGHIFRAHDVAETVQALRMAEAVRARRKP
jgi:dihydropteroate synthase